MMGNPRARGAILIVDDDEVFCRRTTRDLNHNFPDAKVEYLVDAKAAIPRIRETRPDVMLLDHFLITTTGLDLLAEMNSADLPKRPRVIYLTGERDLRDKALQAGADDYFIKGRTDPDVFNSIISRCLAWAAPHGSAALTGLALAGMARERIDQEIEVLGSGEWLEAASLAEGNGVLESFAATIVGGTVRRFSLPAWELGESIHLSLPLVEPSAPLNPYAPLWLDSPAMIEQWFPLFREVERPRSILLVPWIVGPSGDGRWLVHGSAVEVERARDELDTFLTSVSRQLMESAGLTLGVEQCMWQYLASDRQVHLLALLEQALKRPGVRPEALVRELSALSDHVRAYFSGEPPLIPTEPRDALSRIARALALPTDQIAITGDLMEAARLPLPGALLADLLSNGVPQMMLAANGAALMLSCTNDQTMEIRIESAAEGVLEALTKGLATTAAAFIGVHPDLKVSTCEQLDAVIGTVCFSRASEP